MPDDLDTPLTPLDLSRAATGRRHYRAVPAAYEGLSAAVDTGMGYPHGAGTRAVTERGLPPASDLPLANDDSGHVLLSIEERRISLLPPPVLAALDGAIAAGHGAELTADEYAALLPVVDDGLTSR